MASMSITSIQLPTELWTRIMRFNSHPCADMIRKLKDGIVPDDYVQIDDSVFDPDAFVDNLTLEVLN